MSKRMEPEKRSSSEPKKESCVTGVAPQNQSLANARMSHRRRPISSLPFADSDSMDTVSALDKALSVCSIEWDLCGAWLDQIELWRTDYGTRESYKRCLALIQEAAEELESEDDLNLELERYSDLDEVHQLLWSLQ